MNQTELNLALFEAAYNDVFNEDGTMKACGREVCMKLIVAANNIGDEEYGDLDFGRLDIDAVKRLHNKLFTN